jgi:hypothetical protein
MVLRAGAECLLPAMDVLRGRGRRFGSRCQWTVCCAAQEMAGTKGEEALLIARFAGEECAWQSRAMGVGSVDAGNGDGRQRLVRARGHDGVAGVVVGGGR